MKATPSQLAKMDPVPDSSLVDTWRKRRNAVLILILIGSAVTGALDVALYYHRVIGPCISFVSMCLVAVGIVSWCLYDSRAKALIFPARLGFFIFFLGVVGVPLYFWQSRTRREFYRSGFGVLLLFAAVAPYYFGWYATRSALRLLGYYS